MRRIRIEKPAPVRSQHLDGDLGRDRPLGNYLLLDLLVDHHGHVGHQWPALVVQLCGVHQDSATPLVIIGRPCASSFATCTVTGMFVVTGWPLVVSLLHLHRERLGQRGFWYTA